MGKRATVLRAVVAGGIAVGLTAGVLAITQTSGASPAIGHVVSTDPVDFTTTDPPQPQPQGEGGELPPHAATPTIAPTHARCTARIRFPKITVILPTRRLSSTNQKNFRAMLKPMYQLL